MWAYVEDTGLLCPDESLFVDLCSFLGLNLGQVSQVGQVPGHDIFSIFKSW